MGCVSLIRFSSLVFPFVTNLVEALEVIILEFVFHIFFNLDFKTPLQMNEQWCTAFVPMTLSYLARGGGTSAGDKNGHVEN